MNKLFKSSRCVLTKFLDGSKSDETETYFNSQLLSSILNPYRPLNPTQSSWKAVLLLGWPWPNFVYETGLNELAYTNLNPEPKWIDSLSKIFSVLLVFNQNVIDSNPEEFGSIRVSINLSKVPNNRAIDPLTSGFIKPCSVSFAFFFGLLPWYLGWKYFDADSAANQIVSTTTIWILRNYFLRYNRGYGYRCGFRISGFTDEILPLSTPRILPFEVKIPSESNTILIWTHPVRFNKLFERNYALISSINVSKNHAW